MPDKIIQPVTAPTLTSIQQQAQTLINQCNVKYAGIGQLFGQLANFIYARPNPQDAFDAFGTKAGDLFNLAAAYVALKTAYEGSAPASPVPAGAHIVINADGTVTFTPAPTT